jgi:dTDP-4-amino-4,6-dideoxygalactose transaminase
MIPFNKPHITGKETDYVVQAVSSGHISGNGIFTNKCQNFFETRYGFKKCLLTSSCTDALEMAAILCDIKPGDEVIVPAFTFVSTALAFIRQGAKIILADSRNDIPNIDTEKIEKLITSKTKAIVPVHYAGYACDMDKIMDISQKYGLLVIEDAAHAIDSFYRGRPLGSIGHFATFSFHETKNITSGEGGMLVINNDSFIKRAEIIWEKGTNRNAFFRGEINKYEWVDTGSSFLPSEIMAAFLWSQIECLVEIQNKRKKLWNLYYQLLCNSPVRDRLQDCPDHESVNANIFYLVCDSLEERTELIERLKSAGIQAVFHYTGLHNSIYYKSHYSVETRLPNCDNYAERLLRLPLFYDLQEDSIRYICAEIISYYTDVK